MNQCTLNIAQFTKLKCPPMCIAFQFAKLIVCQIYCVYGMHYVAMYIHCYIMHTVYTVYCMHTAYKPSLLHTYCYSEQTVIYKCSSFSLDLLGFMTFPEK